LEFSEISVFFIMTYFAGQQAFMSGAAIKAWLFVNLIHLKTIIYLQFQFCLTYVFYHNCFSS
jgi:hypothetical protein